MTANRILALLELAESCPVDEELAEYLHDPDPGVRRTALGVLSEATEDWAAASLVFAAALHDPDASVRAEAAELVQELREVLVPGAQFAAELRTAAHHADPEVRAVALGALWRHRLCTEEELTGFLVDPEARMRCEAVLGLVSLDSLSALAGAAADGDPAVRLAVARGIAAIGDPRGTVGLIGLAADAGAMVRAAALAGMARTGCSADAAAIAREALRDPNWEVRQGAARALAAADPATDAAPLLAAATDENLDVRKAAVEAIGAWLPARPELRPTLEAALLDPDADVRAHARMLLHSGS